MVDLTWLLDNIGEIGMTGLLVIFVWLVLDGKIILSPTHKRETEAGDKAIALLETMTPKLAELEKIAAVQKVRDEYGAKELDECRRELDFCKSRRDATSDRGGT